MKHKLKASLWYWFLGILLIHLLQSDHSKIAMFWVHIDGTKQIYSVYVYLLVTIGIYQETAIHCRQMDRCSTAENWTDLSASGSSGSCRHPEAAQDAEIHQAGCHMCYANKAEKEQSRLRQRKSGSAAIHSFSEGNFLLQLRLHTSSGPGTCLVSTNQTVSHPARLTVVLMKVKSKCLGDPF